MEVYSVFQKLCNDAQVKVFGKCCQLKPGGDSSSSLDSSVTLSSEVKDQCPKYQVRALIYSLTSYCHHFPGDQDIVATGLYLSIAYIVAVEMDTFAKQVSFKNLRITKYRGLVLVADIFSIFISTHFIGYPEYFIFVPFY